jgi:hypothetical protein
VGRFEGLVKSDEAVEDDAWAATAAALGAGGGPIAERTRAIGGKAGCLRGRPRPILLNVPELRAGRDGSLPRPEPPVVLPDAVLDEPNAPRGGFDSLEAPKLELDAKLWVLDTSRGATGPREI